MPSYQHDIHFTLEEARAMLPWLRQKIAQMMTLFEDLTERGFDIVNGTWEPSGNGHSNSPPPDEYKKMLGVIAEMDAKGIMVRNFRVGVVDFPHINANGEEVYLCWTYEEETVNHWHRIPDTFRDRKEIRDPGTK